jgi:2-keto-4-pentenoate hydratase
VTRDGEGAFTLLGLRALEACDRADVVVVAVSERPREEVAADARVLGVDDFIFEDGFVIAGEEHVLPVSATRAEAIAVHARARGLTREECVGVGASLDMAPAVGAFWLATDAAEHDPVLRIELARHPNVRVAEAAHGPGVYEAVVTTLAERR